MLVVTVALAEIRETPLSVDEVLASVTDPRAGGTCLFVGTVRDHDGPRRPAPTTATAGVSHLDYSAHPQAGDVARALADRLAAEGRVVRIAVVHRVGHLEVGDLAVVCGVSAAHRGEAFDVCRALIDEFKATRADLEAPAVRRRRRRVGGPAVKTIKRVPGAARRRASMPRGTGRRRAGTRAAAA